MDLPLTSSFYITAGASLLLLVVGFVLALILPGIDRMSRRFFIAFFFVQALSVIAVIIDGRASTDPALVPIERAAIFAEWLFYSALIPIQAAHLLYCRGEDWRHSLLFRGTCVMWCVYLSLLVIAQFTPQFYYVSPDNLYNRGPLHTLLMAPLVVMSFANLVSLVLRRDMLSKKYFTAFLIYLIPMTVALLAHMFAYVVELVFVSSAFFTLVMFALILSDQIERYARQQREIAQQRANIMVLQMRPHFIYNTMTSIYYLCEQDPSKAQQVTLDFTTYLRKNFTAIVHEDSIPFSEELEHARAYLDVEQAQYEEALLVDYDTPYTQFRVPPLTLQPIVENAVKHGMDPDSGPLHIWVRTRELSSGGEIVVEDNGTGFDPTDDTKPHMALANIKQRLEMMCNGTIDITPRAGGGTVVRVTVRR